MENAAPQAQPVTPLPAGVEPIAISGGESPASWDDLEKVTAKPKAEPKPKEAKETKEVKEPKNKEAKQEKETKAEESEKKEGKELEKPLTPAKLLKLKNGETELDVAADALVPVKIDGKVVEIPLQEAINRYSQQSHLDKLFKSYKTEKETFDKERKTMGEALNKSYDYLVNQKDLRGFIDYLSEAMGVDAQKLYQDAVGNLQKQIEEYSALSPEERRFKELESENAYYKKRMDAERQAQLDAKSNAALERQLQSVMADHQMDQAAVTTAWDQLTKMGYDPNEITPEFLGDYYSNTKRWDYVEKALGDINPELAGNTDLIQTFTTLAIETKATTEEIQAAIEQVYGKTPEKKLSEKVDKNMKANAQKGSKKEKNPGSDPLFFDDI